MSDTLKFVIPGKPEYLQVVRMSIGTVASQARFNMEAVDDIKLATEEACKIVACHRSKGFSDLYEIDVTLGEQEMEIVVTDSCKCGEIDKNNRHFCMQCPEEGELSTIVIETLMDEYEVEATEANKKVRMVKKR